MIHKVDKKVFAIGLGYYNGELIQYDKVFMHIEEAENKLICAFITNFEKIFIYPKNVFKSEVKVSSNFSKYNEGIFIQNNNYDFFLHLIKELKLQEYFFCNFMKKDFFICILEVNKVPLKKEELFLILKCLSDGVMIMDSLNYDFPIIIRDFRRNSGSGYSKPIKNSKILGILNDSNIITLNKKKRNLGHVEVHPGEFILIDNTLENQAHFKMGSKT